MPLFKLLLFVDIFFSALSQILLKVGMKQHGEVHIRFNKEDLLRMIKMYFNFFVIAGSLVYALSVLLWVAILSNIDLSYAYPLASLNYPLVALSSRFFFKEHVSRFRWFAIAVIMVGVSLVSIS
ncbi:hypothetical protein HY501_03005 [Candidatus Woesearchaeota archaeon]|nr:hypothetical protein [Candidatus Woesearchaeota archaeon]